MKLFWVNKSYHKSIHVLLIITVVFLQSCATLSPQFGKKTIPSLAENNQDTVSTAHTLYLLGDAGNADEPNTQNTLSLVEEKLKKSDKNTTLLFLGDNIYPSGMPSDQDHPLRASAETKLKNQLKITENFSGKTFFLSGNHDWYQGIKGLKEQEVFINNYLKTKKAFLPKNNCPLESVKINDFTSLIVINSQWFLEDWNLHPTLNDDCDIKTREKFFEELESLVNKNQNKITLIAIHHPLVSNGSHGGQFSLRKQLFPASSKIPLPILGSLINLLRKTSGISPQDLQNKTYASLIKRVFPIIQNKDNIIVLSGHEHNLQYIEHEGLKQIVSGSTSKKEAARAIQPVSFSFGGNGYTVLDIKKDQSVEVHFFSTEKGTEKEIFRRKILTPKIIKDSNYPKIASKTIAATIYSPEMTQKSKFYKFLWGKHYRDYYSKAIEVPVAYLDTLYGGLQPTIAGGGHQSLSLRLKDKNGREFVMRGLKKSAARFLQTVAFKDQNIETEFKNTTAEKFIYDYYTTSHPYTPFIIGNLAEKAGIYHSNPKLFYIPKQNTLGQYNETFGDGLYMVEERPTDEHKELASFGKPEAIVGSDEVLANLRKDSKYEVDEASYIKARLFDMLIGDWDRHADQWRWAEFHREGKTIYQPIPRDRDQAFSKADGALLQLLTNIPAMRHMKSFKKNFPDVKWFNLAARSLDLALIRNNNVEVWKAQANAIVHQLTDEAIDLAFTGLPSEINQDLITVELISNLKNRKKQLEDYAVKYQNLLEKKILLLGTDQKEKFVVTRLAEGVTQIDIVRSVKGVEEVQFTKLYHPQKTKEIWIYGLDDNDVFVVEGQENTAIVIRLIGGQNSDTYTIRNGKKVKIYDFKSKANDFTVTNTTSITLTDDYETNEFYYKRPVLNAAMVLPTIGSNPDDGVKLGMALNYVQYGFINTPYARKHNFKGNYYFATQGFELFYNGIWTKVFKNWNFEVELQYTTPNFSINYFGFGNETINEDRKMGMNFNRVKIQQFRVSPAVRKLGRNGSDLQIQSSFESIEVEKTPNRFINLPDNVSPKVFNYQQFVGIGVRYGFENYDNVSLPTMGMTFYIQAHWKTNLSDTRKNFPYLEGAYGISHKITPSGQLVFGTVLKGKAVLNNNYEFYQGATLGGDYDVRGYRTQRYLGKQAFYQSSDLRWTLGKIQQSLIPMRYGVLLGYDYGRVWLDGEHSKQWHQSVGGGLWLNGLNSVTGRLTFFNGSDGNRIAFGLGFGF